MLTELLNHPNFHGLYDYQSDFILWHMMQSYFLLVKCSSFGNGIKYINISWSSSENTTSSKCFAN